MMVYHRPSVNHALGYCIYHRWELSHRQIKNKGCLNKNCTGTNGKCKHLKKYTNHPYWEHAKREEELKQLRKLGRKNMKRLLGGT